MSEVGLFGHVAPEQGQRNKPVTGYCARCGEPLSAGQKTCPHCGHHNG